MKRFFEHMGLVAIILFSFFYTERAALLVQSKSPIMESINEAVLEEETSYVNAEINGNTIIPGAYGSTVNTEKSYLKMKDFGVFNRYYLVYDEVKPEVSIDDNKEKIIVKGNKQKKSVAIIINGNNKIKNYLNQNNIPASELVNESNVETNLEPINNADEKTEFNNIESILNKNKNNVNICLINSNNKDTCIKNKKYLVKETITLNSTNIVETKKVVEAGAIFLISESARLEDFNLLIKEISYKDLKIIYLSELISEK